jgi:chloramphenicol O-acetyltransferase type A
MSFQPIDLDEYARREHYAHFLEMKLTYSVTVQIDVTVLRAAAKTRGVRAYPAQIWMLTEAAHRVPEFRMSRDSAGTLGVFDELVPLYTVLNEQTGTFSGLWTPFAANFADFARAYGETAARFADGSLAPQGDPPPNVLNISSIPWLEFTSLDLNLVTDYLLPILTIGKYVERDGRTVMPLAVQVHHAVCDGWHLGQYVSQVQAVANDAEAWING